jgi:hypothetical protein
MAKQYKSPRIAAILNFVLPGLGYIYVGKRLVFGVGLALLSIIIGIYWMFFEIPFIMLVDSLAVEILLAYDGYKTAEEKNNKK